jgi:CP family cyanate transporter-like MFS transporter
MKKEEKKTKNKRQTLVVIGIVLAALSLRPGIVSIGPSINLISGHFGLSHSTGALLTTIPDILMGLLALPAPFLAKKYGRNNLILFALITLFICLIIRAFSPNTLVLLLATAGVGAAIAIAGTLMSGFIKAKFPLRAAFMIGIYSTTIGLGSTFSAIATAPIASYFLDWRLAIGIWAAPALLSISGWYLVCRGDKHPKEKIIVEELNHVQPWKSANAWKVALFFACVNLIFYSFLAWTVAIFEEKGLSSPKSGILLGCFTFFSMIASPVIGFVSKSKDRRMLIFLFSLFVLVGIIALAVMPFISPAVIICLIGFGLGGVFTIGMTLPLDYTTAVDQSDSWTAFTLCVGYLIAALGPFGIGLIRDLTGDFQYSIFFLLAVCLIMIIIGARLKPIGRE